MRSNKKDTSLHGLQSKRTDNARGPKRLNFAIVPPKTPFFVGRKKQLTTLALHFEKKDKFVIFPPITGLGGLGKTQLVHQLIDRYEDRYDHVVWIDATTHENIQASYLQVAEELGSRLVINPEISTLVQNMLKGKHILYIFDNVANLKKIQPYLNRGHVLITTRLSTPIDWQSSHYDATLALSPFNEEEALQFAKNMGQDSEDPDLMQLIQLLPQYPLVLKQLLILMAVHKYTPQTFLHKIREKTELLKQINRKPQKYKLVQHAFSFFMKEKNLNKFAKKGEAYLTKRQLGYLHKQALKALNYIIKNTLAPFQSSTKGEAALQLLQKIACLDAKPLPLHFVLHALGKAGEEAQTRDILSTLAQHGLIAQDVDNIYMHGLYKSVISELYPLTAEEVDNLVARYVAYYDINKLDAASYPIANVYHQMIPHGKKLLNYVKRQRPASLSLAKCYAQLSYLYCAKCNYERAIISGEKALILFKKVYRDTPHPDMGTLYTNIAVAYKSKEDFEMQINITRK